jgi:hypothetical protein
MIDNNDHHYAKRIQNGLFFVVVTMLLPPNQTNPNQTNPNQPTHIIGNPYVCICLLCLHTIFRTFTLLLHTYIHLFIYTSYFCRFGNLFIFTPTLHKQQTKNYKRTIIV